MERVKHDREALRREENAICLLIDIEFLLDTRLALVHRINPQSTKTVLNRGYHQRLSDNFSILDATFDMVEYLKQWEVRDDSLLMESTVTNFPAILQDMLSRVLLERDSMPVQPHIFLDVNFGRYSKLPMEHYAAWIETFSQGLPTQIFIEFVFMDIPKLTPRFISKRYKHIAIYEYAKWIEYHYPPHLSNESMRQLAVLGSDFYFPMLLKPTVDLKEFMEAITSRGGDFFTDLAKGLANILCPRFISSGAVSVINPKEMADILRQLAVKNEHNDGA